MIKHQCDESGGIYIHIPFCIRKCAYCDFYSVSDLSLMPGFVRALEREMAMRAAEFPDPCDTLYLGGGTPSVMTPTHVRRLIAAARCHFDLLPEAEITIEANPGTVSRRSLAEYRRAGVNRINFGVQSFRDDHLCFLGRIHSAQAAVQSLTWARQAGFDNMGLDLIYGLPGQSQAEWREALGRATEFRPEHLSCYMLTYEPGTPLDRRRTDGAFQPLEEARSGDLLDLTIGFLETHGYEQYEISNFARSEEFRSRHNQKYWAFAPYIGLGPSAHSFLPPRRFWTPRSVTEYLRAIDAGTAPTAGTETLTREQQIMEAVYLGLRTTGGISVATFEERFGLRFEATFGPVLARLRKDGLIRADADCCALSRKGMRFLDSVTSMLVCQEF
ncbi:hypothetical protein DENIS_4108 [Desulfonema ishimotonii]|uniref:Heme chaperone HemW n=1 Tax=Desulfonema ishimotonii TaxID=45657 RepID=A0A401G1M5_9BACT|nr:radical SAM family heme chaperone HemW [Desulfonema ishimotonii]GBC63119.1 hypothetical protein DENIS_4108 [Desulfonema ishimotonii]